MFTLESYPVWANVTWMVLLFLAVLSCLIGVGTLNIKSEDGKKSIVSTIFFSLTLVFLFSMGGAVAYELSNPIVKTFNNPYSVSAEGRKGLNIEKAKIQESMAKSLDVDKVQIDNSEKEQQAIIAGDMTSFEAVKDGKLVDGRFYFTKDSIEVLVSGETDIAKHVSVPTGK